MTNPLPPFRRPDTHAGALDEQLARSIQPLSLAVSGLYAVAVAQRAMDPALATTAPTAVVALAAFLLVGLLPAWRPVPSALANPLLVGGLALVAGETLVAGPAAADHQLQWALIGLGAVVLRPRWGVVAAASMLGPWLLAVAAGLGAWSSADVRPILDTACAAALGTVIFVARRRSVLGLVAARWDLAHQALTDPLTGLHNRRGLEQAVQALLASPRQAPLELVYLDLDGFKAVNDRLGHAEGDRALVAVADILRATFRAADVLGRVGGDEFLVIVTPGSDAQLAARRLQERLAAWSDATARYCLSASVGTGVVNGTTAEAFWSAVELADERMYADKGARRASARMLPEPDPLSGGFPMLPALG